MCILIDHPAGTSFTDEWLADFYSGNKDGVGIMYAEDNTIFTFKIVPSKLQDVIDFYDKHARNRECAIHFRMQTHGDIDLTNCHPYQVLGEGSPRPVYLMHSGVLTSGNAKDKTKSDTWHYIADIIRPILEKTPDAFMEEWFMELVESHIGYSNKFLLMDAFGNKAIMNKDSGEMWGEVWMSNTYAWSAEKVGLGYSYYKTGGYDRYDDLNYGMGYGNRSYSYVPPTKTLTVNGNLTTQSDLLGDTPTTNVVPFTAGNRGVGDEVGTKEKEFVDYYREYFVDVMKTLGWQETLNSVSDEEIDTLYFHLGEGAAWGLIELIEDGDMTEFGLLYELDRVVLEVEERKYIDETDAFDDPYHRRENGDEYAETHLKVGML